LLQRPSAYLAAAPVVVPVPAPRAGVLSAMHTRDIGLAVVELGGGRHKATDAIDPRVGLSHVQPLGTRLLAGEPLAWVHAADAASAARAVAQLQAACGITSLDGAHPWQATPCVLGTVASADATP
jgi:thymidine phosphorylase